MLYQSRIEVTAQELPRLSYDIYTNKYIYINVYKYIYYIYMHRIVRLEAGVNTGGTKHGKERQHKAWSSKEV